MVALDDAVSTNDEAKKLAKAGEPAGAVVWARSQTAGRGRYHRTWVSPEGGLYASLLLRPDCAPATAAQISFVAAVALADALEDFAPDEAELGFKWPNDILLGGAKVAGILLESAAEADENLEWLVVGAGVNVTSHPTETPFPATSLAALDNEVSSDTPAELLSGFISALDFWLKTWEAEGFEGIRGTWLGHAVGLGEEISVGLANETLEGTFAGLDADGALILERPGQDRRIITAGDVYFSGD